MSYLDNITVGKIPLNHLMLLYGVAGVGKSTFASRAPRPIFLPTEDGTSHMDVSRLPRPKTWDEVLGMITELIRGKHDYETLIIDTLDGLEPTLFKHLTKGKCAIEDIGGGYGRYVGIVNGEWLRLMNGLSLLRSKMNIIILAHAEIKKFDDPVNNQPYDRYQLKLYNQKSSQLWKEYVDCLLFANYDVVTKKDGSKVRAFGFGERVLFTEHRPSFDAKNRLGLPFELSLDYDALTSSIGGVNE